MNHQRNGQKRDPQTGPIKTSLGRKQNAEKRRIRRDSECHKSKKQCFQGVLWKDGEKWYDNKQCPPCGRQKNADYDVGDVENE